MNSATVATAIMARITADTTLTGLIKGYGMDTIPKTIDTPYIVFHLEDTIEDDCFNSDATWYQLKFFIVTDRRNGLTAASNIIKRLFGDAMDQSSRQPTYGFQRHQLSLTDTEYTAAACVRVSGTTAHTDNKYVFVENFRFRVEKKHSP